MPITISVPAAEAPVGPGAVVTASTSLSSIPADWWWQVLVETTDFANIVGKGSVRNNTQVIDVTIGLDLPASGVAVPSWAPMPTTLDAEQHVSLHVALRDVNGEPMEEAVRQVRWVPDPAGVAYVQSLGAQDLASVTEDLQIIKMQTGVDVGGVIRGVASMLGGLPPSFFNRELIEPDRTGEGRLTRPRGNLTTAANGIAWEVRDWPVGIGIDEGAPDAFEIATLQLRFALRLADGFEFTANHVSSPEKTGAWLWGLQTPSWLDYWIVPGVTVRFWWLVPTFQTFFEGDVSTAVPVWNPLGTTMVSR